MTDVLWHLEGIALAGQTEAARSTVRLSDVTLSVRHGITAVIGASGAGKTSLLNLLVGFEQPDCGTLQSHLASNNGQLPVFWSPQDGGLWPHLTVRQHLERTASNPDKVEHLLIRFDLAHRAGACPQELSQGERSRVSVARTLATGAKVILMDEPLAHVDPQRVDAYWRVILEETAAAGSSLIFATHSPRAVLAYARRAICVKSGRVLYEGTVDDLYWRPPTEELAQSLGDCNWLEPDDAQLWFDRSLDNARCYRAQQIEITPDEHSPFTVQHASFQGNVAQASVRDEASGKERLFHHRPGPHRLQRGQKVAIRLLTCVLAMFLLLTGCTNGDDPVLKVREVRAWSIPASGMRIPQPRSVSVDKDGRIIVIDTAARVLIFDETGKLVEEWRLPDNKAGNAEGTCVLKDGRVAVADTHYSRIILFDRQGKIESMFGENGTGPGQFIYPVDVAQDEQGNLYISEYGGNDRVQKFDVNGKFLFGFGGPGADPGQFQRACGLVLHKDRIYVADAGNHRVQVFALDGKFLGVLGTQNNPVSLHYPYDVCASDDGKLYVIEYGAGRVTCLDSDGKLLGRFGSSGRGERQFHTPWGIAIDSKGRLRIADTGNARIVELKL